MYIPEGAANALLAHLGEMPEIEGVSYEGDNQLQPWGSTKFFKYRQRQVAKVKCARRENGCDNPCGVALVSLSAIKLAQENQTPDPIIDDLTYRDTICPPEARRQASLLMQVELNLVEVD